jgi:hypothetical protein
VNGRAEVYRLKSRLDRAFTLIEGLQSSLELQAHFARYLCVLTNGYLEKSVEALAKECCRLSASGPVLKFAQASLDGFINPYSYRIENLIGSFDQLWKDRLTEFLTPERAEAINSIVGLKNNIAHGGEATVTYLTIKSYYELSQGVIEFLTDLLVPVTALRSDRRY